MDATKPYRFIGLGAMDVTKPYKIIGFGAMDASTITSETGVLASTTVTKDSEDPSFRCIIPGSPVGFARYKQIVGRLVGPQTL